MGRRNASLRRIPAVFIGVVLLGSACTDSSSHGDEAAQQISPEEVAERIGFDIEEAELSPVFHAVPGFHDPRDGYARDLLARFCLEGVIDYQAELVEDTPFENQRTGQPIFNEEIARRWGYSASRLNPAGGFAVDPGQVTPEVMAKMEECGAKADDRLGSLPEEVISRYWIAGWDAVEVDPRIAVSGQEWRACMAPAGIIDLPDRPEGIPSASVRTPGAWEIEGAEDVDPSLPVGDTEREAAVKDAECRTEVGYEQLMLQVISEAELEAIGRDWSSFEAAREEYERYTDGVIAVIAELGG